MNQRITELRKTLGLTMEKFGEPLGIKKNTVSQIESGKNNVTDQMCKSICREFNVNEHALRTGEGWPEQMFNELPEEDEVAALVYDLLTDKENPFFQIIVATLKTYNQLTPENRATLTNFCQNLLENLPPKKEE